MKKTIFFLGFVAALILLMFGAGHYLTNPLTGPEHVFQLEEMPRFLTDELAVLD